MSIHRILGLTALTLMLVTSMGCNKMIAQYQVGRAEKRRDQAKALDATRFANNLLDQTTQSINGARDALNRQDYQTARNLAKEASTRSEDLLSQTKVAKANSLKEDASYWLDVAKINQAEKEDAKLYAQVQLDNEKGLKVIAKQKYDKSIQIFGKVVSDIEYLLKNLENKSKESLADTKKMKEDLTKEGAPEHAPEYIDIINQYIEQVDTLTNKKHDYRNAIRTRAEALQKKQQGIIKTKEVKSHKQLVEIENLLDVATSLKAEIYAQQNFRTIGKEFENLLTQFYEKNYDTVLTSAPQLKPRVEGLIVETKRESANAMIQTVEKSINRLVDGKARAYLPGRVEKIETLLTDARQLFGRGQAEQKGINDHDYYTESQRVSERAIEVNKSVVQEFDALAQQEINKASESLAVGEGVYNTMKEIFDKKVTGELTGDDKALEDSKHAMKEELRDRLNNARVSLGLGVLKREEGAYDIAIEISKQVAGSADEVAQQTYRVVAHNAILEIANQLTRFEREGGRQWATAEINKTLGLLEESKGLLRDGKYRDAVRRAADTKAQLEILVQELERVAVNRIEKAQQALTQAKENRADTYQGDTFNQAIVSLDRAKASLQGEGLQQAIESAHKAELMASSASEQSLKQWTEDEIRHSDVLMTQARTAGAERYAPEQLQKAANLRKNLQQLYDQRSYKEAIEVGEQAVAAGNEALYARCIEAENNIATAKRFDAWQQDPSRLAAAIVACKSSRELMDKGQYDIALQHAENAINLSKNVASTSKRKGFEARMATLEEHLGTAQRQGAGYYQSKDMTKILGDMNRLRNEFDGKSFEDLSQKIEQLESQLAGVMETTPDVIKDVTTAMQNRLDELEKRHAKMVVPDLMEQAEQKVKFAQLDFKGGKYRPSFENAKDASRLIEKIQTTLDERDFDAAIARELQAFEEQIDKFGPVLNIGSPAMVQMAVSSHGRGQAVAVMNATSPTELRTAITEIGARVERIEAPPSRRETREGMLKMLSLAKTAAANFEKLLIMDMYNSKDARGIVETAYLQMYRARAQAKELHRSLRYPQAGTVPAGVERDISYYGE